MLILNALFSLDARVEDRELLLHEEGHGVLAGQASRDERLLDGASIHDDARNAGALALQGHIEHHAPIVHPLKRNRAPCLWQVRRAS